jgi:RimJ/RimL family protein N-acetyltransferase
MNFFPIPVLESERVRLEPLAISHAQGMFDLWREPAVCAYSGSAVDWEGQAIELPARTRAESDRLLHFWLERASAETGFRWAVSLLDPARFVGAIGFNTLGSCAEYAYHFVPKFWGMGLAKESSELAMSWMFSKTTNSIEVFVEPANRESIRLATRLGFELDVMHSGDTPRFVLPRAISDA